MSSTETINPESITETSADTLALAVFDEMLAPLANARRSAERPAFFARAGEVGVTSYFEPPTLAVMRPADFEFPGGGDPEGLIEALAKYWRSQGEIHVAAMTPRLHEIARALRDEADVSDGNVDILCYTMF